MGWTCGNKDDGDYVRLVMEGTVPNRGPRKTGQNNLSADMRLLRTSTLERYEGHRTGRSKKTELDSVSKTGKMDT